MKAALLRDLNNLAVGEINEQPLGPDEVRVKTAFNGICGSDRHIVDGNLGASSVYPIIMGHEMSGTIVEMGEKVKIRGLRVGDKVTGSPAYYCGACDMCRGGYENFCEQFISNIPPGSMAETVVWKEQQIFKLPEGIDLETGCFAEPVASAMRGIERAELKPGTNLCIFGAGPMGLLQLQLAKKCGASKIMVIDIVDSKLELAKKLGADIVVNSAEDDLFDCAMEATNDLGFERIIEASGAPEAAEDAFNIIGRGGILVYFGVYPMDCYQSIHLPTMYFKEMTIKSAFFYPYVFPRALAMLPYLDIKPLISKVYDLDNAVEAFNADKDNTNCKILIKT